MATCAHNQTQESHEVGNKPKQRKGHVAQLTMLKWSKVPTQKRSQQRIESGQTSPCPSLTKKSN